MAAIPDSELPGHQRLHGRVSAALDLCQEVRDLEFKESRSWDGLQFQIVRAAMGMANQRDGGILVVGVSERGGKWDVTGIDSAHLGSFDEDNLNDFVNRYASPTIRLELVTVRHNGVTVLAIRVPEFEDTPVICKRDGPADSKICKGAIYIRTAGKPQTTRPTHAEELEDLLRLAAEKRARRFLQAAKRIGIRMDDTDSQRFDDELRGL